MTDRRQDGWLREMLADGRLAAAAQGAASWSEVARRLGVSKKAFFCARVRMIAELPSLEALQTGAAHEAEPTVNLGARWPSVDKFDNGELDDPPLPAIPPGYRVTKMSTLVDGKTGELKQQWIKVDQLQAERDDALLDAIRRIADEWPTRPAPQPAPVGNDDLLAAYCMGDPHLGLFSWSQETGVDFDLGIAERTLVGAADRLVSLAPAATHAIVINVGDFFHADNSSNRTLRSGHALDVDTRWAKVMQVGVRTMRRIIDRALDKHAHVRVVNAIGNHDDHSSIMLSIALAQFYEREPRVEVDTSPGKFHFHRFGRTLIGVTHGDTVKAADLPSVMACDRAQDWGETQHRYWITGHIHHDTLKEYAGVTVETLRTMAARDNWSHAAGYRSGRDMKCDVYHREWGRIVRHTVGVHQLGECA